MQILPVKPHTEYSSPKVVNNGVIQNEFATEERVREFNRKNFNQIASICPEHNGVKKIGLGNYSKGGLACVAKEGPESFIVAEGADVRSFIPYHAPNNKDGKMMVARIIPDEILEVETDSSGCAKLVNGERQYRPKTVWPEAIDPQKTVIKYVDPNSYQLKPGEHFIAMNPSKEEKGALAGMHKIVLLEDTGIAGKVKTLSERDLCIEELPYHIFKEAHPQKGTDLKYFVHTYQVAAMKEAYGTEGAYVVGQKIGSWWDLYYANFNRAVVDAMPQLAEKEGFNPAQLWLHDRQSFITLLEIARRSSEGNNFYNGLKMQATMHNSGRDYQAYFDNILGFLKVAFDEKDFEKIRQMPDFQEISLISKKPFEKLTDLEKKKIDTLLGNYFKLLKDNWDSTGKLTKNSLANMMMLAIASRRVNPDNSTFGTVSIEFGKEMINQNDIAYGLQNALKLTRDEFGINDITNGSAPASLNLNKITDIGQNGNELSDEKFGYTPYTPVYDDNHKILNYSEPSIKGSTPEQLQSARNSLEEAYKESSTYSSAVKTAEDAMKDGKAKFKDGKISEAEFQTLMRRFADAKFEQSLHEKKIRELEKDVMGRLSVKEAKALNKNWLMGLLDKCIVKGDDNATGENLKKLFFNEEQRVKKKMKIHGFISSTPDKVVNGKLYTDRIFSSWGRSDEQKGLPTLLQGFYNFLKDESVDAETKEHTKLLFGSAGTWKDTDAEYVIIKDYIKKIQELEGGRYKGNCCYVEGFFPNKLISCCDFGIFTSRFEPCGITPLETYASGNPVLSNRTGGAVNLVKALEADKKNVGEATGILTKHAFFLNEDDLDRLTGGKVSSGAFTKDEARREILSAEVSDMFKTAMQLTDEEYDTMSKNAIEQKIDWDKNINFNNGKSADDSYLVDCFGLRRSVRDKIGADGKTVQQNFIEGYADNSRSLRPMRRLTTGELGDTSRMGIDRFTDVIDSARTEANTKFINPSGNSSSILKRLAKDKRTYIALGAIAVVGAIATYALGRDKKVQTDAKKITLNA